MTMTPAELRSARSEGKCPSARGADLYGADLRGADLRGADLYGADLHEADQPVMLVRLGWRKSDAASRPSARCRCSC